MQREPAGKSAEAKGSRESGRPLRVDRSVAPILDLIPRMHQSAGNRAMGRLVQAKLRVSQPGDAAEREADRIADEVTRAPTAAVRPEQSLRGQAPLILPKPDGAGIVAPAANVSAAISGGGEPLAAAQRTRFESLLGHDFGNVRLHTGHQAAASAEALGALAYTVGSDVVFARGQYAPGTAGGQNLLAHELVHVVQQRQDAPRIQRKKDPGKKIQFLEVEAQDFDEAARNFALMLASEKTHFEKPPRIVVVNGPNVRVYDNSGSPVEKKFFHLNAPVFLPTGVFGTVKGPALHAFETRPGGEWKIGGKLALKQTLDFSKDVDDQEGFNKAVENHPVFYVSPKSTAVAEGADAPAPVPIENLPEFMKFEAKNKANLPAWPSITLPLTPQLATVNSTGSFRCTVDKNQGSNTLDRVTNLMQPTVFRWEVLKLDEKLHVTSKKGTSAWDAAVEGYARRGRNLNDDRRAMIGDTKKQSTAKTVLKAAVAEPITEARAALAIVGQTVMTVINALTGGPNQLSTEDIMDVPYRERGEFFVRCLATQVPSGDKWHRATSVSGCMISVYDIEELASESLQSAEDYTKRAGSSLDEINSQIAKLDEAIAAGTGDVVLNKTHREYLVLNADYQKDLVQAGSNPLNRKVAELTYVKSVLNYFADDSYPGGGTFDAFKAEQVPKFTECQTEIEADLKVMHNRLTDRDSAIVPIAYMNAMLVDEMTGGRLPLTFAVGERQYVAADDLEVVIADVTSAKQGRIFDGRGSGFQGAGRHDAWLDAMDDLRKNLNRGRGYLSYEVPKPYEEWKSELPNPMQLQMSMGAQIKETVDDAAHALTVAAILAAPFTGGASLGILAVLGPIQAASSLYNIVNRSMYDDLRMDTEAVFDLINIVTLGLGKISTAGKFASKTVEIIASSSRLAIRLLTYGQLIMISYETFQVLIEEGSKDPNIDPRELRRKKLLKLLSFFEAASIPIAEKVFTEAHGAGSEAAKVREQKQKELMFDEPAQVVGKKKPLAIEGEFGAPAKRPAEAPRHEEVGAPGEQKAAAKGTAEGATGEPATYKATKAQLKGVPARLHEKIAVVEGLGRDARVVYKRGDNGLITDVQIQIGEHASAADVQTHVAVADMIMKYSGLGGRIRRLLQNFTNLFLSKTPPEIGSRAWEANLEMLKLDRMMRERHAELAKLADQPADLRDTSRMAELHADIDILESQFIEHSEVFNSIEMGTEKGRGYVAAEGLSEGERVRKEQKRPPAPDGYRWRFRKGELELVVVQEGKPKLVWDKATKDFVEDTGAHVPEKFDASTDKREAFRELGGYDKKSSFGRFVEILLELGVIDSRQDVIKEMTDPANRTHDTVRGNAKDVFKERLVERLTDAKHLKKTARYKEVLAATGNAQQARRAAGMEEMLRITERLGPEDRGSIGERVYGELFGTKKGAQHVDVSPAELAAAKGVDVSEIEQGRSIDRLDGNTAREVKTVSTRLGPRERGQINDMLDMVGEDVHPSKGKPRKIEDVAVAFTDPKGGAANASLAYEILRSDPKAPLTFEFHTADGKVLKVTAKNMDVLLKDDFRTKLGLPAKTP